MKYNKQVFGEATIIWYEKDNFRISFLDPSPGNTEYEAYLAWLAEGNKPEIIES